jgi:hypothetical protein
VDMPFRRPAKRCATGESPSAPAHCSCPPNSRSRLSATRGRESLWAGEGMSRRFALFMPGARPISTLSAVRFRQTAKLRLLSGGPGGFRSETNRRKAGSSGRCPAGFEPRSIGHYPQFRAPYEVLVRSTRTRTVGATQTPPHSRRPSLDVVSSNHRKSRKKTRG